MFHYKKALLLFVCCFTVFTTRATTPGMVADTLVKITSVGTAEIFPRPFFTEITKKNGKVKVSYTSIDSIFKEALFDDPAYRKAIEQIRALIDKKTAVNYFLSPDITLYRKHSVSHTDTIETDNIALKELLTELVSPDFKEKTEKGFGNSRVMDGHNFYFEIITPAGVKQITAYEPDAASYPPLHKLLDISMRLYSEKHQSGR